MVFITWINVFLWDALSLERSLSISPQPFSKFYSLLLVFILSHILDDFMFIAPANSSLRSYQLSAFLAIANYAGIPIKTSKTIHPTEVVPIHGIEVDIMQGVARLPQEKVLNLTSLLQDFSHKRSLPLKWWQSLIGHLSFASQVIRPGRPYIRKLIDHTRGVVNSSHCIKLTKEICGDCAMWLLFLQSYNGVALLSPW